MYITEIDGYIEGDIYFPTFEKEQFVKEINGKFDVEIPYNYVTYTRGREYVYDLRKTRTKPLQLGQ